MIWLIDAGHGGMHGGKYMTDPRWGKLYDHGNGFIAYEGVTNRNIATLLMAELAQADLPFEQIHHDYLDTPLSGLVNKANAIPGEKIYLSIHSNAGKGKGFEVFTSKGQTRADGFAEIFCAQLKADFPEYPLRSDHSDRDLDKEENFYVLKHTNCPAVLVELLFFDELEQAKLLNSQKGQERLAQSLFTAIKTIEGI